MGDDSGNLGRPGERCHGLVLLHELHKNFSEPWACIRTRCDYSGCSTSYHEYLRLRDRGNRANGEGRLGRCFAHSSMTYRSCDHVLHPPGVGALQGVLRDQTQRNCADRTHRQMPDHLATQPHRPRCDADVSSDHLRLIRECGANRRARMKGPAESD